MAEKPCEHCGVIFRLRDRKFESLSRFATRKFCSAKCHNLSRGFDGKPELFWNKLVATQSGCLEWTGDKYRSGYGRVWRNGKNARAHRYAYELAKGAIPEGLMVLHSCDNRPCCNPDHLRVGTAKDNMADAIARGRLANRRRVEQTDPRIFEGTLKQAAHALGVSITAIHKRRKRAAA